MVGHIACLYDKITFVQFMKCMNVYYACTMAVLCLYHVYYVCTCVLCLFITTNTLLLEQEVATVKDGLNISSECVSKSFVFLVNQITLHRFWLVNFALGWQ